MSDVYTNPLTKQQAMEILWNVVKEWDLMDSIYETVLDEFQTTGDPEIGAIFGDMYWSREFMTEGEAQS